jgi:AraC-like DNA-binding protein
MSADNALDQARQVLVERIERFTPHDGAFPTRLPGLVLFRISQPSSSTSHAVQKPGLCLVAQGAKTILLERETFEYDETRMLVYSVDIPVGACVLRASPATPYLGLRLDLDAERIAELVTKVFPNGIPRNAEARAVSVGPSDPGIVEAISRLIGLMARPGDAELLGPLVVDEILIRLLRGPLGPRVAQIGHEDSRLHRVGKAVTWLRDHFAEAVEVENLSEMVSMSPSSFHQHFKTVTSMSPLQYQKVLRLQEARRLMFARSVDAGIAARKVGYSSASQFSREYARHFGAPPLKDVAKMRELVPAGEAAEAD